MEPLKIENQDTPIIKALLIEDYLLHQKIMTHYLQQLGYQVDLIIDSSAAIQEIDSQMYDLIIVDINLYGHLSGKEFIQIVRQSKLNAGSPIIVWSAYVNTNEEEKYHYWGADTALKKDVRIEDLKNAIWKCLLKPRREREFYYKSNYYKKTSARGFYQLSKSTNNFYLPFSIL